METLKHDDIEKSYPKVIREMQEKYKNIQGVLVEITELGNHIKLSIGSNDLYLTPEQTVDLMHELRRAVVKIDPKALRKKKRA